MNAPLLVSLGEPAGVGPEIVVKAWRALREVGPAFVVVGDRRCLDLVASEPIAAALEAGDLARAPSTFRDRLPVIDRPLPRAPTPGQPGETAAPCVIGWIEEAARLVRAGRAAALVTAPVAKAPLYQAGFAFPGHTEFLGALTAEPGSPPAFPVMMLIAADLRVSLVTIHLPLARVAAILTTAAIERTAMVTAAALRRDFGIGRPRLALAALNPHAGEGGALGHEEADILAPAAEALRRNGIDIAGPLPADTLFHPEARRRHDAVVCLYHDQALIPVKMLDFWGGVNVTLGLPIVRTSPDHGVGFDIAGRGVARPDSLIAALRLARDIADRRERG